MMLDGVPGLMSAGQDFAVENREGGECRSGEDLDSGVIDPSMGVAMRAEDFKRPISEADRSAGGRSSVAPLDFFEEGGGGGPGPCRPATNPSSTCKTGIR